MASGGTNATPPPRTIRRLLIANRGEIAVRIATTARRLGMTTVAVFSDVDRDALHVEVCDVAVALGGNSPAESYLRADAIIDAALRTGADAIHPGYGFLAENADFAEAVTSAGLIWVGPTPDQIRLLGDKVAAKQTALDAGVETTAAVTVAADGSYDRDALPALPLLVKAAAGGGGRGMRIVEALDQLDDAIASAQRESAAAFGDGTVFIEPFIANGHHVEVQIFGDEHGTIVDLGERECSIQRRNQKVIEEAPSPTISPATRATLRSGAVALARHVGYVGAGTVEYFVASPEPDLVSGGDDPATSAKNAVPTISFLEVNTRLQVEHPVTEATTGVDLVEWQLDVACGKPLPLTQVEINERLDQGLHAIEARVVAEDPTAGWLPSTGAILRFEVGNGDDTGVRVDRGVGAHSTVSADYDSLLAKVIAVGASRSIAAGKLAAALRAATIVGVTTNAPQLAATLTEPDFLAGKTTTAYLAEHPPVAPDAALIERGLIAATVAAADRERAVDPVTGFAPSGWRNLATIGQRRVWRCSGADGASQPYPVEYRLSAPPSSGVASTSAVRRQLCQISIGPEPAVTDDGSLEPDERRVLEARTTLDWAADPAGHGVGGAVAHVAVEVDGISTSTRVCFDGDWVTASGPNGTIVFATEPRFVDHDLAATGGGPTSPLPGTVIAVNVADGDTVDGGAVLMVVEAMKMEHQITAPGPSVVDRVLFAVGDRVDAGDLLVELSALASDGEDAS